MSTTTTTAPANPAPSVANTLAAALNRGLELGATYLGSKLSADVAKAQAKAQVTSANAASMAAAAGSATPTAQTMPAWVMPVIIVGAGLGLVGILIGVLRR